MATFEGKTCRKCGCTERYESTKKCVMCWRSIQRAYRSANKEKCNAYSKAYREANREALKAYRDERRDAARDHSKSYYESHPEKIKARKKSYNKRKSIVHLPEDVKPLREKQYDINSALWSFYRQRKQERIHDDEQQTTQQNDP
jgi:hypothetical protein